MSGPYREGETFEREQRLEQEVEELRGQIEKLQAERVEAAQKLAEQRTHVDVLKRKLARAENRDPIPKLEARRNELLDELDALRDLLMKARGMTAAARVPQRLRHRDYLAELVRNWGYRTID